MKMRKLIMLLFSLLTSSVYAQDFIMDGIGYNIISVAEKTVEVRGANSSEVVIPHRVDYDGITFDVIRLGIYAFMDDKQLESIEMPNSILTIGDHAFRGCSNLHSIKFSDSLSELGEGLFYNCKNLKSVEIPSSVVSIGYRTFSYSGLTSVKIPASVTTIGNSAFAVCENLETVEIPPSVATIGNAAFLCCYQLKSIVLPNSIRAIEQQVFDGCDNLEYVELPSSIESIDPMAFSSSKISKIVSHIENPFAIENHTFDANVRLHATLYVPKGSKEKYQSTQGWREFLHIEDISEDTGISNTPYKDNGKVNIYSLQGVLQSTPTKGIIIRNGRKIICK